MLSLKRYTDLHLNNVKSIKMAIHIFRFHIILLKSLQWNKIRKETTIYSFCILAKKSVIFQFLLFSYIVSFWFWICKRPFIVKLYFCIQIIRFYNLSGEFAHIQVLGSFRNKIVSPWHRQQTTIFKFSSRLGWAWWCEHNYICLSPYHYLVVCLLLMQT